MRLLDFDSIGSGIHQADLKRLGKTEPKIYVHKDGKTIMIPKSQEKEYMQKGYKKSSLKAEQNEGGMPSSIIKHKQKLAMMTDEELADRFKDFDEDRLRHMAWGHGYGKMSSHYWDRVQAGKKLEQRIGAGTPVQNPPSSQSVHEDDVPKDHEYGPSSRKRPAGKRGYTSSDNARTAHLKTVKQDSNKHRRAMDKEISKMAKRVGIDEAQDQFKVARLIGETESAIAYGIELADVVLKGDTNLAKVKAELVKTNWPTLLDKIQNIYKTEGTKLTNEEDKYSRYVTLLFHHQDEKFQETILDQLRKEFGPGNFSNVGIKAVQEPVGPGYPGKQKESITKESEPNEPTASQMSDEDLAIFLGSDPKKPGFDKAVEWVRDNREEAEEAGEEKNQDYAYDNMESKTNEDNSRRDFMRKAAATAGAVALGTMAPSTAWPDEPPENFDFMDKFFSKEIWQMGIERNR